MSSVQKEKLMGIPRIRNLAVPALAAALLLAGCGSATAPKQHHQTASRCIVTPRHVVAALNTTLKVSGKIVKARSVKSTETFTQPRGLTHGVYFVAGLISSHGKTVFGEWEINTEAENTGGGLVFALGSTTRYSKAGDLLDGKPLMGDTGSKDGLVEAQKCVER